MTTNLNYPKPVKPDDGCNWLPVILWRMNAGARARSRSVFVAAPRPAPVPGITPQKPIKREIIAPTVSGRRRKTHIGTVIYSRGEKSVRLSEGATVWSAGSNVHFDKKTGQRVGSIGRHRLVLESIRPLQASDAQQDAGSVTAQQLVSVMKGKTLSYQGILALIQKHYPDCQVTIKELHDRVFGMFTSNYVGITRHDDMPVVHFTLNSVDPRYYIESAKNKRA
ncbi:hypothetical protein MMB85_001665 [Klebsiella quasipneumoniae]|uniref:hypothetical protein n=1 Tax=Klebsiella quasipneumoniae TaxID=1463165 RepID=UPI00164B130D|nr:hypothetical protein [Klebsiella quasipneumoniae]EKT8662142.1 hypothetical protein [Klebsiella quasipneumoniae]MBC5538042.1 hypothetical protein [Klebsiella quasipneumoniae]MBC5560314.1 hypothetical protein [Klebsiella quasipneumoniae]HBQ2523978.1 hypothetical protein [Klebsiella quasipneumoniae]